MIETRYHRSTSRHIHRIRSPWESCQCHSCGEEIKTGRPLYLDTDGGLFCTLYCTTSGPRPGIGAGVQ